MPRRSTAQKLTPKQLAFLELYHRLQLKLGHPASYLVLGREHGGYSPGSEAAGAQRMAERLRSMGLIEMPVMQPVGGGITKKGLAVLKRAQGKSAE